MGYKCPKCGYERKPEDLASEYECPKCGVIYEKYIKSKDENYKEAEALYGDYELSKAKDLFRKIGNKHPELNDKCQNYLKKIEQEEINENYIKEAEQAIKEKDFSKASTRLKIVDSEFEKTQLKVANLLEEINNKLNEYDELLSEVETALAERRIDDARSLCKKIKSEYPHDEKINKYIEELDKAKEDTSSAEATSSKQSAKAISPELHDVKNLIQCPDCGKEVSKRAKACPNCGAPIQELSKLIVCPDCGNEVSQEASTCPNCGAPMSETSEAKVPEASGSPTKNAKMFGSITGLLTGWGCLLPVSLLLCATGWGAIIGIPLLLFAVLTPLYGLLVVKGKCPYCGAIVHFQPHDDAITCGSCKKRIIKRDKKLYLVD